MEGRRADGNTRQQNELEHLSRIKEGITDAIISTKEPSLSVCLEKGKHKDLRDAIVRNEIVHLLEGLKDAKTSQDNEAEQAYNKDIPYSLNRLSIIPLDLIGIVYNIELEGSYLRRITLGFFLDKEDPYKAIPKVEGSGIPDFKRDFYEQVSGFSKEGALERHMGLSAHPL